MPENIKNGTRRMVGGKDCVCYEGYWIRYYPFPEDTLQARKRLISGLTRRTFHHTETGINTPGNALDAARAAYETEQDPTRKRVNAAMLAGALFNRATDIFRNVVDLAEKGVEISPTNELMRQCGRCFKEALELGRQVKHHSGEEGIDELWGEPLKAFTMPIASFYESRYLKISQTMRDIDRITQALIKVFANSSSYEGFAERLQAYSDAAKGEAETMRTDHEIFDVWPRFVASSEALQAFRPAAGASTDPGAVKRRESDELRLIDDGRRLISYLCGARVPMPKSTEAFLQRCAEFNSDRNFRLVSGN